MPKRERAAVTWDQSRGELVLFGGNTALGMSLGDTWTWQAETWNPQTPAQSPPPRYNHAMAYDPIRRRVVLHGGESGGTVLSDTWEWDGVTWTQMVPTRRGPGAVGGLAMAYSPVRQRIVLTGATNLFDWEWDGTNWAAGWPLHAGNRGKGMAQFSAGYAVAFSGAPPLGTTSETWTSGTSTTATFGSACGSPPRPLLSASTATPGQPRTIIGDNLPAPRIGAWLAGGSDQTWGSVPLPFSLDPIGAPGCTLLVSGDLVTPFASITGSRITLTQNVPANPALAGAAVFDQLVIFEPLANPAGVVTTNGVKTVIKNPVLTTLVEEFDDEGNLDRAASSGAWIGGAALPGTIGGSGLLGAFVPSDGALVSSTPGAAVYEWSTDRQTIPGARTLTGQDITVTDGNFEFARFDVPTGITVRFVGSNPVRVLVRGQAQIDGRVELNAPPVPVASGASAGQAGGGSGPGGARGGSGARAGSGQGHTAAFDGQPGADVVLPARHAYVGRAPTTGGRGSHQFPTDGLDSSVTYAIQAGQFSGQIAAGGGGGGFDVAGANGRAVFSGSGEVGPDGAGGVAFNAHPVPAGTLSSEHFVIGGSGGGGGGSHPHFSLRGTPPVWKPGAAGGGGGGAFTLRCGHRVGMSLGGAIEAKGSDGGRGPLGSPPVATGGGGSGGSVLVQTGGTASLAGLIDTSGGAGGLFDDQIVYLATIQGGDGAAGLVRVEVPQPSPPISVVGTAIPAASANSIGTLAEIDVQVACQSNWYWTGRALPVAEWIRYRVDATVNGVKYALSDDPTCGQLANRGSVHFFVQAATLDPATGVVDPASIGPWRQYVGGPTASLNADRGNAYRFVILFDRTFTQQIQVDRVAVDFRG